MAVKIKFLPFANVAVKIKFLPFARTFHLYFNPFDDFSYPWPVVRRLDFFN